MLAIALSHYNLHVADPIWSNRASPIPFLGPKRYRPPPLSVAELPTIHAVVISHNHYDHMDHKTIKALNSRFGEAVRLVWVCIVVFFYYYADSELLFYFVFLSKVNKKWLVSS